MRVLVKKWGNSASVRIPTTVMAAACVRLDDAVDIREENGRIIIVPIRNTHLDLTQMLDAITPENVHAEVSFGPARGKEAF